MAHSPRIAYAFPLMKDTKKRGRPALGILKEKPSVLIDKAVMKQVRKAAFDKRMTLSAFIEESLRQTLAPSEP